MVPEQFESFVRRRRHQILHLRRRRRIVFQKAIHKRETVR
jgi:hypothetical protein